VECLCTGYPSFDCQRQLFRQKLSTTRNLELTSVLISLRQGLSRFQNYSNQASTLFSSEQVQGCPVFGIPGENLAGIYSANEFLIRVNLMKALHFPQMRHADKSRQACCSNWRWKRSQGLCPSGLQLGAEELCIVYRRSRDELPGRHEEDENAEEKRIISNSWPMLFGS